LPTFEEFSQVYTPESLAKDKRKLKEVTKNFESYSGEVSDAVTRLLLHLIYDLEYLKPKDGNWGVYAGLTHPFDDKMRGADMVIVLYNQKTGEELPIAIDTTTSSDEYVLGKKSEKIKQDFKHGNLRKLKYYRSPIDGAPIGRQEMPILILGYSQEQLKTIAKRWQENGQKAFKMLGLENGLKTIISEQFALQEKSIRKIAPANKQDEMIEKLERIDSLINPEDKKQGATEIAPLSLPRLSY